MAWQEALNETFSVRRHSGGLFMGRRNTGVARMGNGALAEEKNGSQEHKRRNDDGTAGKRRNIQREEEVRRLLHGGVGDGSHRGVVHGWNRKTHGDGAQELEKSP